MQQTVPTGVRATTAPTFYVTGREPLRPGVILLGAVIAVAVLSSVMYGFVHGRGHYRFLDTGADRSPNAKSAAAADDKDNPNQVDTIVLGDPADAPVPGRKGDHVSPVHPFVVVHLPRFGDQVGLIPDSPAGRLLYAWLAAFNQASYPALADVLATAVPDSAVDAQMDLRQQTGGFNLISAKEITPGILVFRLRDQTPEGTEVLGTLQMRANSSPAAIESFSLRAVAPPHQNARAAAGPLSSAR
jgi:hypothetical protein